MRCEVRGESSPSGRRFAAVPCEVGAQRAYCRCVPRQLRRDPSCRTAGGQTRSRTAQRGGMTIEPHVRARPAQASCPATTVRTDRAEGVYALLTDGATVLI